MRERPKSIRVEIVGTLVGALLIVFLVLGIFMFLQASSARAEQVPQETTVHNVFSGGGTRLVRLCDNNNTIYLALNPSGNVMFVVPAMMGGCK